MPVIIAGTLMFHIVLSAQMSNHNFSDKDFTQLSHLKRHMKRHDKDKEHKCDTCRSVFLNIENLRRHKRQMHITPKENYMRNMWQDFCLSNLHE